MASMEETLSELPRTRIQLCGRLAAEIEGRRIENELPGRQGRLLFVYLVANRDRVIGREELVDAVWPESAPQAVNGALRALVSKVRRAVGREALGLHSRFRLELPDASWIDLEAAREAIHRAEVAVARQDWPCAWGASHIALVTARRGFLVGEDAPWIEEWRRYLDELESAGARVLLGVVPGNWALRAGECRARGSGTREEGAVPGEWISASDGSSRRRGERRRGSTRVREPAHLAPRRAWSRSRCRAPTDACPASSRRRGADRLLSASGPRSAEEHEGQAPGDE